ncbi:MAG: tRNA-uridine aminocarboxypropyltransferase [Bdellovibrionota bacterium]
MAEAAPRTREMCMTCRQPSFGCYCAHVRKFDPGLRFVILIHPIEVKRRIATGRMSHLCLERSILVAGQDYTDSAQVNEVLADPRLQPFILYPGNEARNLSKMSPAERAEMIDEKREPVIFVIDGTWATARKMMRSENLRKLPRICFSPEKPSAFRVRKQPAPGCVSTIEAIHRTIELFDGMSGVDASSRHHDGLLDVFEVMVQRQLKFVTTLKNTRQTNYRQPKIKKILADL